MPGEEKGVSDMTDDEWDELFGRIAANPAQEDLMHFQLTGKLGGVKDKLAKAYEHLQKEHPEIIEELRSAKD